jgi:UDP-N-acetylglucosamine 2-epimerase
MIKVLSVFGTRPETIKLGWLEPILQAERPSGCLV